MTGRFREERDFLSNQIAGISVKDAQSIKPHFQEFVVKNEEAKSQLENKIAELRKVTEEQQKKIDVREFVVSSIIILQAESLDNLSSELCSLKFIYIYVPYINIVEEESICGRKF